MQRKRKTPTHKQRGALSSMLGLEGKSSLAVVVLQHTLLIAQNLVKGSLLRRLCRTHIGDTSEETAYLSSHISDKCIKMAVKSGHFSHV